jgi:hypothetical protein
MENRSIQWKTSKLTLTIQSRFKSGFFIDAVSTFAPLSDGCTLVNIVTERTTDDNTSNIAYYKKMSAGTPIFARVRLN